MLDGLTATLPTAITTIADAATALAAEYGAGELFRRGGEDAMPIDGAMRTADAPYYWLPMPAATRPSLTSLSNRQLRSHHAVFCVIAATPPVSIYFNAIKSNATRSIDVLYVPRRRPRRWRWRWRWQRRRQFYEIRSFVQLLRVTDHLCGISTEARLMRILVNRRWS